MKYTLAEDVHACLHGQEVVILDLLRDKYLSLSGRAAVHAGRSIAGWPPPPQDISSDSIGNESAESILATLQSRGLVTNMDPQRLRTPLCTITPVAQCTADQLDECPAITLAEIAQFIRATLAIRLSLRCQPLVHIIHRVTAHNCRSTATDGAVAAEAARLTLIFGWLSSFSFSGKDACLAEALALHRFLSHYKIPSSIVFGVRTEPFAAHSWIQIADAVMNDTLERVWQFTPIMCA